MTYSTEHDPYSEDTHPIEAENDKDDVERFIDEAATLFAKLFLEQVLDSRRLQEKKSHEDTSHH